VPFTAVHVPVKPTQEWLSRYYPDQFDDDPLKDLSFKKYAAYTSHMDHGVGQLLESLELTCQRENTIVVFASDNGAINDCPIHGTDKYPGWQEAYPRLGSNAPYRGVKAQLYEGGIRTPTVVNWRGSLSPCKVDHPVQVVDWMPTFTALTGAQTEEDPRYDGQDIWPLITETETNPSERRLFWNFRGGRNLGVRHGDWKLISREADGSRQLELYNIKEDPYEEQDLIGDHPETVDDLTGMIEEERQQDGTSARQDVTSPMVD
jgi:arylsulfatase A-like enzyme